MRSRVHLVWLLMAACSPALPPETLPPLRTTPPASARAPSATSARDASAYEAPEPIGRAIHVGQALWWNDAGHLRMVENDRIVTVDVGSGARMSTCLVRGPLLDASDTAGVVLDAPNVTADLVPVDALLVATCTRIALGRYHRDEPPTVTANGKRAGVTRTSGGGLDIVDTATGAIVQRVSTPPCSAESCSFRTGSGGALQRNGASVEWHGSAHWCESLGKRDACAGYLGIDANSESVSNGSLLEGSRTLRTWGLAHAASDRLLGAVVRGDTMLVLAQSKDHETKILVARWPQGDLIKSGVLEAPTAHESETSTKVDIALSPDAKLLAIREKTLRIVSLAGLRWSAIQVITLAPER